MKYLIKKEILSFFKSHNSIGMILLLIFTPYLFLILKIDVPYIVFELLFMLGAMQYIYDSITNDKNSGAILFCLNSGFKYFHLILGKIITSLFVESLIILIALPVYLKFNCIKHLLEIILCIPFSVVFSFFIVTIFKGEEVISAFFCFIISLILIFVFYIIPYAILKFVIILTLFFLFYLLSKKIFNSKYFRRQL